MDLAYNFHIKYLVLAIWERYSNARPAKRFTYASINKHVEIVVLVYVTPFAIMIWATSGTILPEHELVETEAKKSREICRAAQSSYLLPIINHVRGIRRSITLLIVCLIHLNSTNSWPGSENSPIPFESEILAIAKTGSSRRNNFAEVGRWVLTLLMQIRNSQDFRVREAFGSFRAIPRLINCNLLFFPLYRGYIRGGRGGQKDMNTLVELVKMDPADAQLALDKISYIAHRQACILRVLIYWIASLDYYKCKTGIGTFKRTATHKPFALPLAIIAVSVGTC
jgi:hypothetical protein